MGEAKLLTAREVKDLTGGGISERRAHQAARLGIFPPGVVVRFGRQVRFAKEPLLEFIAKGGRALPGGWRREAPATIARADSQPTAG